MVDLKKNDEYRTPSWVKWSAGIAIVVIFLAVAHFYISGMSGMHSMAMGG